MNTIILNGSPKKNIKECNSQIIAETFVSRMNKPFEIKRIAGEDPEKLAKYITDYDRVLFVMPLYIHAMPGIVMKFFEALKPAAGKDKEMGFIVQAGFMESAQHRFLKPYLKTFTENLGYRYLGYMAKGEAAGIYMFPKMFKKVLEHFAQLGELFEKTGAFDPEISAMLSKPVHLSKKQLRLLKFVDKIGLGNIGWHSKLRKNGTLKYRLDRPYL